MPVPPPSGLPPPTLARPEPRLRAKVRNQSTDQSTDPNVSFQQQTGNIEQYQAATLDQLRDTFERQYSEQQINTETELTKKKAEGEKEVADIQKKQREEINRVKNSGDRDVSNIDKYYRNRVNSMARNTSEELNREENLNQSMLNYERKKNEDVYLKQTDLDKERFEKLAETSQKQAEDIKNQKQTFYEDLQTRTNAGLEKAQESLTSRYQDTVGHYNQTIQQLNQTVHSRLDELKKEALHKISEYQNRMDDPFYQGLDIPAKLTETDYEFVLTATIPTYEQDRISANIHNNHIVLSGQREVKQSLDSKDGTSQSTSSFQSFSKKFPLDWDVEANKLKRETQGDQVIFRVPKHFI